MKWNRSKTEIIFAITENSSKCKSNLILLKTVALNIYSMSWCCTFIRKFCNTHLWRTNFVFILNLRIKLPCNTGVDMIRSLLPKNIVLGSVSEYCILATNLYYRLRLTNAFCFGFVYRN